METFNKNTLNELVNTNAITPEFQNENIIQARQQRALDAVDDIFTELKIIAPVSFAQSSESDLINLKTVWMKTFIDPKITQKITPKFIHCALSIARQQVKPFIPTPGQFIEWGKQAQKEELNIIKPHELIDLMKRFSASRGLDNHHKFNYGSDLNYWLVHELYKGVIDGDLNTKQAEQLANDLINSAVERMLKGWTPQKQVTAIEEKATYTPVSNPLDYLKKIKQQLGLRI